MKNYNTYYYPNFRPFGEILTTGECDPKFSSVSVYLLPFPRWELFIKTVQIWPFLTCQWGMTSHLVTWQYTSSTHWILKTGQVLWNSINSFWVIAFTRKNLRMTKDKLPRHKLASQSNLTRKNWWVPIFEAVSWEEKFSISSSVCVSSSTIVGGGLVLLTEAGGEILTTGELWAVKKTLQVFAFQYCARITETSKCTCSYYIFEFIYCELPGNLYK